MAKSPVVDGLNNLCIFHSDEELSLIIKINGVLPHFLYSLMLKQSRKKQFINGFLISLIIFLLNNLINK